MKTLLTVCRKRTILSVLLLLFIAKRNKVSGNGHHLREIIEDFNVEYKIELNLLIDLTGGYRPEFDELIVNLKLPKILIRKPEVTYRHLFRDFNMKILTIVRMPGSNRSKILRAMDQLLWQRHYTTIIVMFEAVDEDIGELLNLFRECWQQGHTSVLVWWHNVTYTYEPYPQIQIRRLANFLDFKKPSAVENLQMSDIRIPLLDHPPRCFSYHNRQGQMIKTGYYYKLIETFVKLHNGTLQTESFDMWASGFSQDYIVDTIITRNYSFVPTQLMVSDNYTSSDAIYFGKGYLITPTSKEIPQSMYLLLSFDWKMWLMTLLIFMLLVILIYIVNYRHRFRQDLPGSALLALQISIFISARGFERKIFFNFMLHILFLLTGFFITNFYSCNLSSMYTSRIYEPELFTLKDVARTDLGIHIHSVNLGLFSSLENLPDVIYQRLFAGNNTEFNVNRQNLNMIHIFQATDDIGNWLLHQQLYLKRPLAKYIPEPLFTEPLSVVMPHRSTLIERFNRYLSYVRDSGILAKFMDDSLRDGVVGGTIHFFRDKELNRSLPMSYFEYAFVLWLTGLVCALFAFLCEVAWNTKTI